jgi:DNA (cytosine-5)-methyltransferase 1
MRGISLFCGCGGSDLGAKYAGIDIRFANDCYSPAVETYKKYKNLLASEDTDICGEDIRNITRFPACDILLGCYPCQSFTMGGRRSPAIDARTNLYLEFQRCLEQTKPKFFVAENVAGMQWLHNGLFLAKQVVGYSHVGAGYFVTARLLDAKDYGVPADRKRIFLVGVRSDLGVHYWFPEATHGPDSSDRQPYVSHGEALQQIPLDTPGEYYHPATKPFSWWFMSRNRKRPWASPAYTVVSNWRHVTLHPASPTMRMVESTWRDKSKQKWEFTDEYEHLMGYPERSKLETPRRLSWRECAVLQTFPRDFEPVGTVESKYWQIGNAVPPLLMANIVRAITSGSGLRDKPSPDASLLPQQMTLL